MNPEEEAIRHLKEAGTSIVCTLPCDKVKALHHLITKGFSHVPLTREEEGVGISGGASLAGGKPTMLVQSSGLGNMINALASLTLFYELPLFILVSWRGVYQEGIAAQKPMGGYAPTLLNVLGIDFVEINERDDLNKIGDFASRAFDEGTVTAAFLSPKIWEESLLETPQWNSEKRTILERSFNTQSVNATQTRYEILKGITEGLRGKVVVSNLGIPSKELYHVLHQPSNFYMLGSMGMATPLGLGIALGTQKEVVVIDGDGSLLMNAGSLATVSEMGPENLTILAVDNAAHGSTGNQPTATKKSAHLEMIARGMGIKNTYRAVTPAETIAAMESGSGPRFVHIVAKPGNASVENIPLTPHEIKANVMEFLRR
jgi:sulfopyruvate decarboxylase subunit beta